MKSKLKDMSVAQTKGCDFVSKCLKKRMTEPFEDPEGVQFFYDAEFDYGVDGGGKKPLLFIGELSSEWRKYIKANKAKMSLAAGRCMPSKDDPKIINLEVKLGKGGKQKYLKEVNKEMLKPFAFAQFVDSLASGKVQDGDLKEEDPETDADAEEYTADVTLKELLQQANEYFRLLIPCRPTIQGIIDNLKAPMADISKVVVTDQLIATAKNALFSMISMGLEALLPAAENWLKGADLKDRITKNEELKELVGKIDAAVKELKTLKPQADDVMKNVNKLQKVANPQDSPVAPVTTNAGKALENSFKTLANQFSHVADYGSALANIIKIKP